MIQEQRDELKNSYIEQTINMQTLRRSEHELKIAVAALEEQVKRPYANSPPPTALVNETPQPSAGQKIFELASFRLQQRLVYSWILIHLL